MPGAHAQSGKAGDVIEEIERTLAKALSEARHRAGTAEGRGRRLARRDRPRLRAVVHAANVPGFGERVELGALLSEHLGGVRVAVDNDVSVGVLGSTVSAPAGRSRTCSASGSAPASAAA